MKTKDQNAITVGPSNAQVAHYEYAPFGEVTSSTGTRASANPYRFSSEFHDDTLGLVYYNYRHYNPKDGRWISRDLDEKSDRVLYLFVENAPVINIDQIGLMNFNSASCKDIAADCIAQVDMIKSKLFFAETLRDDALDKIKRAYESGGWKKLNGWGDNTGIASNVRKLHDLLVKGASVDCCASGPGCQSAIVDGKLPAAAYIRTISEERNYGKTFGADLSNKEIKRGTIYLCDRDEIRKQGGCGCVVLHEMIHKTGLFADETEYKQKNYRKDRAVVRISQILTRLIKGMNCKGYGL